MQADIVHRPALPAHIGRHLQNIPDQDQDPLDDQLVVLQPLVPVLLQQRAQRLGQDFPKSGVNEGRFEAFFFEPGSEGSSSSSPCPLAVLPGTRGICGPYYSLLANRTLKRSSSGFVRLTRSLSVTSKSSLWLLWSLDHMCDKPTINTH